MFGTLLVIALLLLIFGVVGGIAISKFSVLDSDRGRGGGFVRRS